jgi:hypothetical protein
VVVNPASIIPGILREMMQISNQNPRITPRDAQPQSEQAKAAPKKAAPVKSTSAPKAGVATGGGQVDPEGGWSSPSVKGATKPAARGQ